MAGESGWQKQRTLCLFSAIDGNMAYQMISQIYGLAAEGDGPISLLINSGGGAVRDATAIIEAVKACPVPVHTIGIGQVYSSALLILITGNKRLAYPNTLFMAHQFTSGTAGQIYEALLRERQADDWTFAWMREHYREYTKVKKPKKIERTFLSHEYYFDEQEAIKLGVIDEVIRKFPLTKLENK